MKKRSLFYFFTILIAISYVFRNWFLNKEIIGGDWPSFFEESLKNYSFFFSSWNPFVSNGFGGINPFYSLGFFHGFTIFLSKVFHLSWPVTYKFSWFGLFIALSIFSSVHLLKVVLPRPKIWQQIIAAMVFTTNTYILMIVSGGQMGVALAYSTAPLVLASFIKVTDVIWSSSRNIKYQISNIKYAIIAGLILAAQVMFDPRIVYLTMIAVALYLVLSSKKNIPSAFLSLEALAKWGYFLLYTIVIPIGIVILLHAVWILPILFLQSNPIPEGLKNVEGLRFFSFADFSHAFSFLHPNWPENIFGKTYFLRPEFLLLPILAYSSLLFLKKSKFKTQNSILFFALLGLVGAFLAKGANPPFGEINTFLFEHIPGMSMFRDPTKFYLLIALSYSVLIPFSINSIYNWLKLNIKYQKPNIHSKYKIFNFSYVFLIFTICYLIFLIRPVIFGQLGGTFEKREVPLEYVKLKDFLHGQPDFFRVLWVPRQHRFTYYSLTHLPVEAQPLFKKAKITDIVSELRKSGTEEYLSELGIKYVIVPYDPNGEIFVKDRRYDETQYFKAIEQLGRIPWLVRSRQFEKIAVFEVKISPKALFWLEEKGTITYSADDITHYSINVEIDSPQRLIFSENFHPKWQLVLNDKIIHTQKTAKGLNSFLLGEGNYQGNVVFFGDKYYAYGKIISLSTVVLIGVFLFAIRRKKVYNT